MADSSYQLKLAQKRFKKFQLDFNASLAECAKILLIDKKKLTSFSKQLDGSNLHTQVIMMAFGEGELENNITKLQSLRGTAEKSMTRIFLLKQTPSTKGLLRRSISKG